MARLSFIVQKCTTRIISLKEAGGGGGRMGWNTSSALPSPTSPAFGWSRWCCHHTGGHQAWVVAAAEGAQPPGGWRSFLHPTLAQWGPRSSGQRSTRATCLDTQPGGARGKHVGGGASGQAGSWLHLAPIGQPGQLVDAVHVFEVRAQVDMPGHTLSSSPLPQQPGAELAPSLLKMALLPYVWLGLL